MTALRAVPDTPPRALIYLRQSKKRDDSISLEVQEAACRDYCARKGYIVVDVLAEQITGQKWERRPKVQEMMRRINAGDANLVVLYRWSRISRVRLHQALAIHNLRLVGADMESAIEPFDTRTAAGEFGRDMMLDAAVFQGRLIGEQWREAHDHRRESGLPHDGRPRAGYVYDGHEFRINAEEAPVWREAYLAYIRGDGFPTICKMVNAAGLRNPRTGKPWIITTMMRTLDSGFLAGLVVRNGRKAAVYSKGAHEPVITDDTWELYSAARRTRAGKSNDVSPKYRMSGLVRCGDCSAAMVAGFSNGTPGFVFECGAWRRGEGTRYVSSARSAIEKFTLEWLAGYASDVERAATSRKHSPDRVRVKTERQIIGRQIAALDQQLVTLTRQLAAGLVPDSVYIATRDEVLGEQKALQASLDEALLKDQEPPVDVASISAGLVEHWDVLPVNECRRTLAKLIRHVVVHPPEKKWGRPTFSIVPAWEPVCDSTIGVPSP